MKPKFFEKIFVALSLGGLFAAPAMAQENSDYGNEWQHAIAIYAWGAGIGGHTARGTGIDVGFDTVLDNLEFAFMGAYQARKGKWSIMADFLYLDVSGDRKLDLIPPIGGDIIDVTTDVSLDLKGKVFHLGGGYNLYNRESTTADFVFGARYLDLSTDLLLNFNLGQPDLDYALPLSASGDVWDAFIGFKGNISLGDRWFIPYYADIGAGDSDFTWQATAGIAFKAADWADITLVYRYLSWDIGGDLVDDINFSGPALGVIFRF
jgi:hypothetical protein